MANKQSTTPQFLTQEKLRAIAAGLGRGMMAYDPNNPFAGAGAALATVAGIEEERALRNQNFAEQRQTLKEQQEFSRTTLFEQQKMNKVLVDFILKMGSELAAIRGGKETEKRNEEEKKEKEEMGKMGSLTYFLFH